MPSGNVVLTLIRDVFGDSPATDFPTDQQLAGEGGALSQMYLELKRRPDAHLRLTAEACDTIEEALADWQRCGPKTRAAVALTIHYHHTRAWKETHPRARSAR